MGSSRCADISAPTLREVREGWGTPCVVDGSEIKSLGHPPATIMSVMGMFHQLVQQFRQNGRMVMREIIPRR
jgi:hypothetical protein